MNAIPVFRLLVALGLFMGAVPNLQAQTHVFVDVDFPGATATNAWDINDANHIIGWYEDAEYVRHGFIYDGAYATLDDPDAIFTSVNGINNAGTIVGMSARISGFSGFIYDGVTYAIFAVPGALSTSAEDINDAGTVVGSFGDNAGVHGFAYDGMTFTTLDFPGAASTTPYGINNVGTIVGMYDDGGALHGFIYDGTYSAVDVPSVEGRNVVSTALYGINDDGAYVGSFQDTNFLTHGFIYDEGAYTIVEPPSAGYNEVTGINSQGSIAGWYSGTEGIQGYVSLMPTFDDVPTNYWAFSFIETLAGSGITAGCGNSNYCPIAPVTRAQMAVFLERGMNGSDYSPPAATGTVFLDVGAGDFAASFIEQLSSDGITAGCGNNNYCPDAVVTRAQMAVFLLRAEHGSSYSPPAATGVFVDVPLSYWAVHWIEQLAAEGITAGCGGGNYCPEAQVTRDQMAVFLVRTFGL